MSGYRIIGPTIPPTRAVTIAVRTNPPLTEPHLLSPELLFLWAVVIPSSFVLTAGAAVTFLRLCVGSMLGVLDTRNWGATGIPLNVNRWSFNPSVGSWNIWYSS